jgi:sporulation protein YlmC with PRC-barrel domain
VKNTVRYAVMAAMIGLLSAGSGMALEPKQFKEKVVQTPCQQPDPGKGPRARASELVLIGASVETSQGESVGTVEDMILDTATGEVVYVVLSKGGSCAAGDRLTAVPAGEFKMKDMRKLEVRQTREDLDKAPSFQRADWARIEDSSWSSEIDAYYQSHLGARSAEESG